MAIDPSTRLSANFTLAELVASDTAERDPALLRAQRNPPDGVVHALGHLCSRTLQPVRETFGFPIRVTSGYRSPVLNERVGGSPTSQHVHGQAADCRISSRLLDDPEAGTLRREIAERVLEITGRALRQDVNANFFLFAYVCLHLDELDIDQVIHEYGEGPGRPAWVHVAASAGRSKREILRLGRDVPPGRSRLDLASALRLGTSDAAPGPPETLPIVQGANPEEFTVRSGESVLIRVTAIDAPQLETVSGRGVRGADASPPGRLYRLDPRGPVGGVEPVQIQCVFPEAGTPGGLYRVTVCDREGVRVFEAPEVHPPAAGRFPRTASRTLRFFIEG